MVQTSSSPSPGTGTYLTALGCVRLVPGTCVGIYKDFYQCLQKLPYVWSPALVSMSMNTLLSGLKMVLRVVLVLKLRPLIGRLMMLLCIVLLDIYVQYNQRPKEEEEKNNTCFLWNFYRTWELRVTMFLIWLCTATLWEAENIITGIVLSLNPLRVLSKFMSHRDGRMEINATALFMFSTITEWGWSWGQNGALSSILTPLN